MPPENAPTFTVSTAPLITVLPPVTLIPLLAVIRPTESMLVTSSYVSVPPMETFPLNVAATPVMLLYDPLMLRPPAPLIVFPLGRVAP